VDKLAGDTNLDTRGKLTKAVANLFKEQGLPKWAIRDTVEAGDWELARRVMAKTSAILRSAATVLQMEK